MKTLIYTIIVLLSLGSIQQTYAADNGTPFSFGNDDKQPLEVTADDSIEWIKEESKYVATGNAIATKGTNSIQSNSLTAIYDPIKGQTEIKTLIAVGNVIMTDSTQTITGDKAIYNVDTGRLTVTGNGVELHTPTQSITASQSLEYFNLEQKAIATGNVVAKDGTNTLKTDRLITHFMKENGKTVMKTADTYGRTQIITPTEIATGDSGHYDARTKKAKLKGNVKITRGENQMNGDEAEVDMTTGFSQIISTPPAFGEKKKRVRALFVPEDDESE